MANIIRTMKTKSSKQSKQKLERLKLGEIWEILTDKRFGVRFKIANLICRDYLRNYLVSVNCEVNNCIDILDHPYYSDENKIRYINRKLKRAKKTLNEVFDF